jgi:protein O-GlcNAc transferase
MTEKANAFQAALQHHKAGQLVEAAVLYETAIAANPEFADAVVNLAALRAAQGDFEAAEKCFARALELLPEDTVTLVNYGNLLQRRGDHEAAATNYRSAISHAADLAAAHVGLGNALLSLGHFADSIDAFNKALEFTPDDISIYNSLGSAWLANGYARDALNCLDHALSLDPLNAVAHFNYATALCALDGYEQAIAHFDAAARINPAWAQAHLNKATALCRCGRGDEAIPVFREGLALQPDNLAAKRDMAGALIDAGERDEPRQLLTEVLAETPNDPDALYMAANLAHLEQRFEDAILYHQQAIKHGGDVADNNNNMANVLLEMDRTDEALKVLLQTLAQEPEFAEGWNSLGNAWLAKENHDEAARAYGRALQLDPTLTMAANNLAASHLRAGRLDQACDLYQQNTNTFPEDPDTWTGLGTVYLSMERYEQALESLNRALELDANHLDARHNRAAALHRLARFTEALQDYRRVIELAPRRQQSHFNLGSLLQVLSRHSEAIEAFEKALEIDPGYTAAWSYLAHSLKQECRWDNLETVTAKVIDRTREEMEKGSTISTSPFSLLQLSAPGDVRLAAARQTAKSAERGFAASGDLPGFTYSEPDNGKLRIGYISPDFRGHSVGRAFLELLAAHDRERFELIGYFTASGPDDVTARLVEGFDQFVELDGLPFPAAAQRINDDGIHILVDLAGHTRGARFEVLAHRPAPVQAHFLGYGFTIGADYVDYLITDEVTIPETELQWCHENIVYLPHHSLPASRPVISDKTFKRGDFGLPESGIVFADFNGHYKFDAEMFAAWMEILQRKPDAVLWLMKFDGNSDNNLRAEAEKHGIDANRLVFAEKMDNAEHLARLSLADLALDTYHHAGGVTSTDALWAGLPVLTLLTDEMVDRTGASLMRAAGLPEMIATSLPDFVEKALTCVDDPMLRTKLAEQQKKAPLFDMPGFTRHLEHAYEAMWQARINGTKSRVMRVDHT